MEKCQEVRYVKYEQERWKLLDQLRNRTISLMNILKRYGLEPIVHGSIARGDVTRESDIDVFIPYLVQPYLIEEALSLSGIPLTNRIIIQATPFHAVKGYLEIDKNTCISFPLVKLRNVEYDFYKFGGSLDFLGLKKNIRVPGVNKHLMLIIPTKYGHKEMSVIGKEGMVANLLGISMNAVKERIRILLRRKEVGRTGVFLKRTLMPNESFGNVLSELCKRVPSLRKRLRE